MNKEQKEHAFIQSKIAEENKEIKLVAETVETPPVKYFEVIAENLGTENEGNGAGLKEGELFEATMILTSAIHNVESWIVPSHLPFSGLNTIASDLCKELDKDEYELKLKNVK